MADAALEIAKLDKLIFVFNFFILIHFRRIKMKKLALLICLLLAAVIAMSSCGPMFVPIDEDTTVGENNGDTPPSTDDPATPPSTDDPATPPSGEDPVTPNPGEYTYNAFTAEELSLIAEYFDFEIPFIATNEYGIEPFSDSESEGLYYYTVGNTESEFEAFLNTLTDFEFYGTDVDDQGYTWYFYDRGDACLDVTFYEYGGESYIELYLYYYTSTDEPTTDESPLKEGQGYLIKGTNYAGTFYFDGTVSGGRFNATPDISSAALVYVERSGSGYLIYFNVSGTKTYVVMGDGSSKGSITTNASSATVFEWNSDKKTLVVMDDDNNRAFGMKPEDSYSNFSCYDVSNSYNYGEYIRYDGSTDPDVGGDNPPSGGDVTPDSLITNIGAGLPEGEGGVYEIVFTDALYVKDVTDQASYVDGCPTTGNPAVLVIPVEFSDRTASSLGYDVSVISDMLCAGSDKCDYYSLHDYYYISSYGKLDLDITVLDYWFRPSKTSSYYYNQTIDYFGEQIPGGDQMVLDEALAALEPQMDLSRFDSDNNGIIDAVILVTTLEIDNSSNADTFYWAYRYWNLYTDSDDYYFEYDGVSANDYIWMSYQFIFESTDAYGSVSFDDKNARCPYTFIHEFGHILGADDYYDTTGESDPLGGLDVMDAMCGDHNAFTKINLGWITSSRLVTTDSTVTLTLDDFSKNGDTIIIGSNWNPELGAYQEYFILMYYTNTGLNDGEYGYFDRSGVLVYKINASLYATEYDGETVYDIYNTNTSPSDPDYGTEDNLIEYVLSAKGGYTFVAGDKPGKLTDSTGNSIGYTFVIDSITDDAATITFSKI